MFFSPVDVKIVALRNGLYVFFVARKDYLFSASRNVKNRYGARSAALHLRAMMVVKTG